MGNKEEKTVLVVREPPDPSLNTFYLSMPHGKDLSHRHTHASIQRCPARCAFWRENWKTKQNRTLKYCLFNKANSN